MNDAYSIELQGISKSYTRSGTTVEVLKKIDLTVMAGEFFVLLGPSGCGKSTLLNLCAGLDVPSEGKILLGEKRIVDIEAGICLQPYERDAAMVFQSYALYPHMTVAENLAFPLRNRKPKLTKHEIETAVKQTAEMLQIHTLLDRKPAELSGGQRQRVAIGRALVRKPKIFLLDEPLSNLDAQLRHEMRAQLKTLQEKLGITTIYVTHDQTEAMTLANRLAVLNQGQVQQLGTPSEVYKNPVNPFVAQFIGSPPMNLLKCNYSDSKKSLLLPDANQEIILQDTDLDQISKLLIPEADSFLLGVRPEDLIIVDASNARLKVELSVIENLGSEWLGYTYIGSKTLIVRSSRELKKGNICLSFASENMHLFPSIT